MSAAETELATPPNLWRRNLRLRLVTITLLASIGILGAVGAFLVNRVTTGLLDAKQQSALTEASSARAEVQRVLDASDTGLGAPNAARLVDTAITALSVRAGAPGLYDALLLSDPNLVGLPERGTKLVTEGSLPADLRIAVQKRNSQVWAYTTITYADGVTAPGIAIGAPVNVPRVGAYELYLLFPLNGEQETISLVTKAVFATGALLLLGLVLLVWFMTSRVTDPVREAADVAEEFAQGDFDRRMTVRGHDDLAILASSFNSMAASLQEQITRLEQLSHIQQRFVSDVSHELRSPLTTVRMASEMIFEGRHSLSPDVARAAELLNNEVNRFDLMLSDLLEISRVDAGEALLELGPIDVVNYVRAVVDEFAAIARSHNTHVNIFPATETIMVSADQRRIGRILRNLVSNAIEHCENKPIDVMVAQNDTTICVAVRDYGQGMTDEEQARIFDRFWRANPSRTRTLGGTGLGLAISADDARLHDGDIHVWGAPGKGAHFVLVLPRTAAHDISDPAIRAGVQDV